MPRVTERGVVLVGAFLLTVVLAGAFVYVVWHGVVNVNEPPKLADPAPTSVPTPNANSGELPEQLRGSYDTDTRLLGWVAIVAPLLTTLVGFYFGQRAGGAEGRAASVEAEARAATVEAEGRAAAAEAEGRARAAEAEGRAAAAEAEGRARAAEAKLEQLEQISAGPSGGTPGSPPGGTKGP